MLEKFEKEYEIALNWVISHPKEIGLLAKKELNVDSAVIENAITTMGLHYKNSFEAKETLFNLYKLLFSYNPSSIGGKIPDSKMLYEKEI